MIGPLCYIGGKRRIAKQLAALIPIHTAYVEPFAGGAQLFFHKAKSRVEVLNDVDNEITNFFRVCQRHPQELARTLHWQPASRRLFEQHLAQPPHLLTDVERAARFFFLQNNGWGGKRVHQNYHYGIAKPPSYRPQTLPRRLLNVADRLSGVQIESADVLDVLGRFDRPTTFFYCDPPYVGVDLYRHNFAAEQFEMLAKRLEQLEGRFLLSINDCAEARHWFRAFRCRPVTFTYTSLRTPRRFTELLFSNYPLPVVSRRP